MSAKTLLVKETLFMKSILLRLYDGEICPAEQFSLKTDEYRSMRQAQYQHYEDFIEKLKSLAPPLHEKFIDIMDEQLDTVPLELSGSWEETLVWSCLQGIMGKIYTDDFDKPTNAMAIIGDFAFFAGKPNIELVSYKPVWCTQNFMIMIPQNEYWINIITQNYGEKAKIVSRYAIKMNLTFSIKRNWKIL